MGVLPVTMFGIFVVSEIISWLVLILIPSRKGFLKSSRTVSLPQTNAEQALGVILRRLGEERFENLRRPESVPLHIVAERPSKQFEPEGQMVFTHAAKPIEADVQIMPRGAGVEVTIGLKMTDFVLLDTGEGEHLEQVMHRLADGTDRPPVAVANPSALAMSGVCWAMTTLAAASLASYWPLVKESHQAFAGAIAMSALASAIMAVLGLRTIIRRPREITGVWLVVLALLGAMAGMAVAGAIYLQLGPFAPDPVVISPAT